MNRGRAAPGISACVISYNRAAIVGTCLRALHFADEVILVDKTSTDGTRTVAARLVDRVVTVPFSPTVEETRAFAVDQCRHDWILLLDDDECLNRAAVDFITAELADPSADAYAFPLRHYILGTHDPAAYYWPEHHVRLFRRGAVAFGPTVHAGMRLRTNRVMDIPPESGACIHHLSHRDVADWVARTNRYTSRPDRARADGGDGNLLAYAQARLAHWQSRSRPGGEAGYTEAVAILRAIYDMVDRLKDWEAARPGADGTVRFRTACAAIEAEFPPAPPRRRRWPSLLGRQRAGVVVSPPAFRRPPE